MTWYDVEYTFLTPTGERKALAVTNTFEPPPPSSMKLVRVRYRQREGLVGTPGEWVEVKAEEQAVTNLDRVRALKHEFERKWYQLDVADIMAVVEAAVAEEREACAETARSFAGKLDKDDPGCKVARLVAAAIRERGRIW